MRFLLKREYPFHWNHNAETCWSYVKERLGNFLYRIFTGTSESSTAPLYYICMLYRLFFFPTSSQYEDAPRSCLLLARMYRIHNIFNNMCSSLHALSVGSTEKSLPSSSLPPPFHRVFIHIGKTSPESSPPQAKQCQLSASPGMIYVPIH